MNSMEICEIFGKRHIYSSSYMNRVILRLRVMGILGESYIFYIKSGIFKRQHLCAYLELDNVLGHYEIVLLEIC